MKKFFWISLFGTQFFTLIIFAQEKQLFGFGPFDWNSGKEVVKDIMKEKFNLLPGYEKEDAIGFEGGEYFGEKMHIQVFFFEQNKLNEVDLVIENINRSVSAIFYEIIHNMNEEYGDPDLFQPDEWIAEWFYYDFPDKKLNATIKISPYTGGKKTSIKIVFLRVK
ncbi:MAG TPA: hypothetical protein VLB50_05425 [Ignavibacteriaceae bacterium]|nr:hypothetical protein [Ignavibacteriaceae bacterium]